MTEWTVVTVVISLVGLLVAVATPIIKLNATITRLTTQMENFMKGLGEFKTRYTSQLTECKRTHADLYDKVDNHERRITVLEAWDMRQAQARAPRAPHGPAGLSEMEGK